MFPFINFHIKPIKCIDIACSHIKKFGTEGQINKFTASQASMSHTIGLHIAVNMIA